MDAKAIIQRWPIKQEYRQAIIARLVKIVADPKSSPREVTAASKALLAAEGQNQTDEHKIVDVELQRRNLELDTIAAELGIEKSLIVDAEGTRGGDHLSIEKRRDE